jgi:tRNA 2-selenouridine synthase
MAGQKYWYKLPSLSDFTLLDFRHQNHFEEVKWPGSIHVHSQDAARKVLQKQPKSSKFLVLDYARQEQAEALWDSLHTTFEIYLYKGGFNRFARHCIRFFCSQCYFISIGGKTGSGKTEMLRALQEQGFQALDLEEIAESRGSVFDETTKAKSQAQFDVDAAFALQHLKPHEPVLVEREGKQLGPFFLPEQLHEKIIEAPCIWLASPIQQRIAFQNRVYANTDWLTFRNGLEKIAHRLTSAQRTKAEIAMGKKNRKQFIEAVLPYYDSAKSYAKPENVLATIRETSLAMRIEKAKEVLLGLQAQ